MNDAQARVDRLHALLDLTRVVGESELLGDIIKDEIATVQAHLDLAADYWSAHSEWSELTYTDRALTQDEHRRLGALTSALNQTQMPAAHAACG